MTIVSHITDLQSAQVNGIDLTFNVLLLVMTFVLVTRGCLAAAIKTKSLAIRFQRNMCKFVL